MIRLQIGEALVLIDGNETRTVFASGAESIAHHMPQLDQSITARRIGAPSVEAMNRTHDLAHSLVARALGLPASPTLLSMAEGWPRYPHWRAEENAAFALQTWAFATGVDLVQTARAQFGKEG